VNDRSAAISPSLPPPIIASATSAPVRSAQQAGAARTKLLLEDGAAIALYRSLGTMKPALHFDIEVEVGTIKSEAG